MKGVILLGQREYTPEELEYLITCPKKIVNPPKKTRTLTNGHYRNCMDLSTVDNSHKFHVFMRKNVTFEENFTIGLNYIPREGGSQICLVRCNGPHGEHINDWYSGIPHYGYHIHKATAENINAGLKPEKFAVITTEYATYEEALLFFLKRCNIKDGERYFPRYKTIMLFPELGESNGK